MTADNHRNNFFKEIEKLHSQVDRPGPVEIVQLAVKAGLNKKEVLFEVANAYGKLHMRSRDSYDVLSQFLSFACEADGVRNVLEYSSMPLLLSVDLINDKAPPEITAVTYNKEFSESLMVLMEGIDIKILNDVEDIFCGSSFDAIIAQTPWGYRPPGEKRADGFGGEVIINLARFLNDKGTIFWIAARGVVSNSGAKKTLAYLEKEGFHHHATIDLLPGLFIGTNIGGVVLVFRRDQPRKKFVGILRDTNTVNLMAQSFHQGPRYKSGSVWEWLDGKDLRTYTDIEQERLLQKLIPRGRSNLVPLEDLLLDKKVYKADMPIKDQKASTFLYIPVYSGSRVTSALEDQTVEPKNVYRLTVDPAKANLRFLVQLLNSPFGKCLRNSSAQGATIKRIPVSRLLSLKLPLPEPNVQNYIAEIDTDIHLLETVFQELRSTIEQSWKDLEDTAGKLEKLKAVLDIERQVSEWWHELPYPLATIYRRYQVETKPKERFEILLHFFEMAAIYLAVIGMSHVKEMHLDWEEVKGKWLYPRDAAGIKRTDFGFWIGVAGKSLKEIRRITSDKKLKETAQDLVGLELLNTASTIGKLGKATEVFNVPREYRNSWKGHGGFIKEADAIKMDDELQQSIRELYEVSASIFKRLKLVRVGKAAEYTNSGLSFEIENLTGSDPTFERSQVELDLSNLTPESNKLAFWMSGSRTMCRVLPFFRLGTPQQLGEPCVYVFNRVEEKGVRWISYQEAQEQEFFEQDDEISKLISIDLAND